MFNFPAMLSVVLMTGYGAALLHAQTQIPTAKDVSVKAKVPTPTETFTAKQLNTLVSKEASGTYAKDRVITPPMALAVRQEHPDGPRYQEAETYNFLVHSMKFPGVVRMDSGRLVLVATAWLLKDPSGDDTSESPNRGVVLMHSDDEAQSWSQPKVIHWGHERPEPIYLGGQKIVLIPRDDAGFICFSEDGGDTWGEKFPFPTLPDGTNRQTFHHGSPVVEGSTITSLFYVQGSSRQNWSAYSLLRRSRDGGRTWGEEIWLPPQWLTSEGSLTRAQDGALVVSLRTGPGDSLTSYNDHWRRIRTARSMDDGKTWTDHQVHFKYGKVHSELLTLSNGDILMTYAARMGELEGKIYHGIEAVLSHDHGKTWDWDHRFILFRWANTQAMHTPDSLQLDDGRILTVFCYHYDGSWGAGAFGARLLGISSAVIWDPDPDRRSAANSP